MQIIADLQLHSKYSRAVSPQMTISFIGEWAAKKGIGLVATGDWTHPLWFREIQVNLEELGNGFLKIKNQISNIKDTNQKSKIADIRFLLATEVSSIYSQGGKGRRVHTLIWVPSLAAAGKINEALWRRGCNLMSDGRPIIGLSCIEVADLVLNIEPKALIIPAHCLPPTEEVVIGNYSSVPIEKIRPGDMVLTHSGTTRRVTEAMNREYKGKLIRIQPWYFRPGLLTTPEHPYLAIKTLKKCPSTGDICRPSKSHLRLCKRKTALSYKPEWVVAKDLTLGDVLVYPRVKTEKIIDPIDFSKGLSNFKVTSNSISAGGTRGRRVERFLGVTPDFGRLIGYFLAEGYIFKDSFAFCFSQHEEKYIKDILEIIEKTWGLTSPRFYRRKKSSGVEVTFDSKIHTKWFTNHCYRLGSIHRAEVKKVPDFIFSSPLKVQAECLRGWYRGDKGYTISRALMNQMKTICVNLGIIPSITVDTKLHHFRRGNHNSGQRIIKANHDLYAFSNLAFFEDMFSLKPEVKRSQTKIDRRHGWVDEKYVYLPIKDITSLPYKGKVYNLEVEGDHSYVAEFAAVHNCWTPWFSVFGGMSGFDSLDEAFGKFAKNIYAVETGLSSNPAMNWRIKELDNRTILSFSDAHSGPKLGREATVFDVAELSYENIRAAISQFSVLGSRLSVTGQPVVSLPVSQTDELKTDKLGTENRKQKTDNRIAYTIEFYPEEGKYHYSGHRNCGVSFGPEETVKNKGICPVCGRGLTQGVMQRVEELAGRTEGDLKISEVRGQRLEVRMIGSGAFPKRPPFAMLVPLLEIIAEAIGSSVSSPKTLLVYENLVKIFGGEFAVLLTTSIDEIGKIGGERVAEGIEKVRKGDIEINPGYDGMFGKVKIWREAGEKDEKEQLALF